MLSELYGTTRTSVSADHPKHINSGPGRPRVDIGIHEGRLSAFYAKDLLFYAKDLLGGFGPRKGCSPTRSIVAAGRAGLRQIG
jgi:hypothetical protein